MNKKDEIGIVVEVGTGLANKTKPRRIPEEYKEKSIVDAIRYLENLVQKDGNEDDRMIMTDIHDQMKKDFIIEIDGRNVSQNTLFGTILKGIEEENAGDEKDKIMFKNVSITVSSVQKGG